MTGRRYLSRPASLRRRCGGPGAGRVGPLASAYGYRSRHDVINEALESGPFLCQEAAFTAGDCGGDYRKLNVCDLYFKTRLAAKPPARAAVTPPTLAPARRRSGRRAVASAPETPWRCNAGTSLPGTTIHLRRSHIPTARRKRRDRRLGPRSGCKPCRRRADPHHRSSIPSLDFSPPRIG